MRKHRIAVGTEIAKIDAIVDFLSGHGYGDRLEIEKQYDEKTREWIDTNIVVVLPKGKSARDLQSKYLGFSLGYNAGVIASLNQMSRRLMELAK